MLVRLGVRPLERGSFVLADGARTEIGIGQTMVRLDGRQFVVPVVFGDENAAPLLGVVTLETFRLGVDTIRMRLVPAEGLLMRREPADPLIN